MATLVCPNCGNEITLKVFTPKSVKCSKCKNTFTAEYEDTEGNLHPGGWEGFEVVHPKVVKAAKICGRAMLVTVTVLVLADLIKDKVDELSASPETSPTLDMTSNTTSQDCETTADSSSPGASSENSLASETSNEPRKYAPRDPDNYDTIQKDLDLIIVNMTNRHASPEKRKAADELNINLDENQTFRNPHKQSYQVRKDPGSE
jgi:DNA-directed RNA polymerase subunit RPC12/RpoP